MLDKPKLDLIGPSSANTMLAGEKFTDNQQCEFVFGSGSKICSYMVSRAVFFNISLIIRYEISKTEIFVY
jgi:hypothetical protein